jgi:glycosyltransferase involved in cell wall biosynthesis
MKILIICNCTTGLETFRGMLIKELINKGNDVSTAVPWSDEEKELRAEKRLEKLDCNLKHISIDRRGMNPIRDINLFLQIVRLIKVVKPDLVITYTIKPNIYGGFASRLLNVKYVVNVTGLGTAFQKKGMLRNIVVCMYKFALKKAKVVFFENTENRDTFVDNGIIQEKKAHVLPGAGVDLEHYHYLEYPKDEDKMRFLFIGRVMREKGVDELFAAMSKLNKEGYDCELDVLGEMEENYTDIIAQYEREGWLHFRGYQEDVRLYVKKCHCFVLPSWHEGMANTNLECAACGRPIITSDIHGCKEAIINNTTGLLFEKGSLEDLYYTFAKFIKLPNSDREKMGWLGRKHMEELFDKRKIVKETLEALF